MITLCPLCHAPTHATESADDGVCVVCTAKIDAYRARPEPHCAVSATWIAVPRPGCGCVTCRAACGCGSDRCSHCYVSHRATPAVSA